MTDTYLFIFGNTPSLSFLELQALLPGVLLEKALPNVIQITDETKDLDPVRLINILGGTKKILQALQEYPLETSREDIETYVTQELAKNAKTTFALAEIGRDHLEPINTAEIKQRLKEEGIKTRYIDGSRHGLSSAVLSHQKVRELNVVQTGLNIIIAETVAVQDIDAWTFRDRGKPYADRKKGMLPPKVARMMVNLAIGAEAKPGSVLLDPFCGTGTVLIEALDRGVDVLGSDLDAEAVAGSTQNLNWFIGETENPHKKTILHQDATQLRLINHQKVEYLVTEPFLGKPKPEPAKLANIFKGLEKQYLGSFKHWRQLLYPGAKVVCVFPAILADHTPGYPTMTLETLIDKLQEFGYTTSSEPVVYHRPQAVISRQIYQFVYQPK